MKRFYANWSEYVNKYIQVDDESNQINDYDNSNSKLYTAKRRNNKLHWSALAEVISWDTKANQNTTIIYTNICK